MGTNPFVNVDGWALETNTKVLFLGKTHWETTISIMK